MGKCLLVSGSLEVCNDNFLQFCVYSCYRNCYAKLSCGEGQVKKTVLYDSVCEQGESLTL